jgi:hypothetical protein
VSSGVHFLKPIDPGSEAYERPPIWRRNVAPARVTFPACFGVFLVVLIVLTVAGVPDRWLFVPSMCLGFLAQGAAEIWWRRNRPPRADRVHRPLWSRGPEAR